ncbi:extracellular solute-binding protein [Amycolatopsis rubida]|uniref:Extracellular solute-binding protein n=1 Tax=Amycolatopsis rubida TaxID=112413 RepID=A0ABX0C6S1_9PSEU|nr:MULTISPECIES: extracellular solute-binding protein [Amycolatopsis]MYW96136.1 extracellular solute-binding protein [Amycolatopsis rubida]NEC61127.1 extracellular solute-binding protein [Amycolatopsis rubida]OAP23350.1 Bacterial extracellular solute-binding protein [Amycolatopsis sp. M39]
MYSFVGRRRGRRLRIPALLLAAALGLSACGGSSTAADVPSGPPVMANESSWNSTVTKANGEHQLVIYWSMGTEQNVPNFIAAFKKKYPDIKVKIVFQATGDLVNRLDQEMSANVQGADVVVHASPAWFSDQFSANHLAALQVSPENQAAGWQKMLNNKSFATWWGFAYVLGYRTAQPKPPTNLKALLDSNPKARIGLVDPHASQASGNVYETLPKRYGDGILDQLAKSNYTIEGSNSQLSQALAAGSVDYAYPDQINTTAPLIAKGAPLGQIVTNQAVAGAYYNVGVVRNAPDPNAAQVFANFAMSKDGQAAVAKDNSPAATVPSSLPGAIPWGTVKAYNPADWTSDKWNAWIAKYWTPRFK